MLFNRHFEGNLKPIDAEQILINFVLKLPEGTLKLPYKKVIENYLSGQANQESIRQDKKLNKITKLPFGEDVIEALAHYLRSSEEKKEVPLIKQQRKNRQ